MRRFLILIVAGLSSVGSALGQYGDSDIAPGPWKDYIGGYHLPDAEGANENRRRYDLYPCPDERGVDDVSKRIIIFAQIGNRCEAYSLKQYIRFEEEISAKDLSAPNYFLWSGGERLLPPSEAEKIEQSWISKNRAAYDRYVSILNGTYVEGFSEEPAQTFQEPTSRVARSERSPKRDGPGACGVPYIDEEDRQMQLFAKEDGECAEYVEEYEADRQAGL